MPKFRKFAVAMSTFGVALSIGFVMQNGDAMAARFGTDVPTIEGGAYDQPMAPISNPPIPPGLAELDKGDQTQQQELRADGTDALTDAEGEVLEAVGPAIQFHSPPEWSAASVSSSVGAIGALVGDTVSALASDGGSGQDDAQVVLASAPGQDCEILFGAETAAAATVNLTLYAPCQPEAQVSIHHQGMIFTLVTSESGVARATVPALAESALFMAEQLRLY